MKVKKINMVLALALVVAGITGHCMTVEAGTESLEWTVQYDGGKNFKTLGKDATNSSIGNAMPGDTIQYIVTYTNNSADGKTYDFYLDANVLKSLEDGSSAAQGGGYSYKVDYEINGTTSTVIDSETIGGDNDVSKGLNQVSNDSYVSVGRLTKGQSGIVTVSIALDGNSQDNSYMETIAQMSIQFAVQEAGEADGKHEVIENTKTETKHVVYTIPGGSKIIYIDDELTPLAGGGPQTGDSILPLLICGITLLIGIMFIAWYFKLTKDEKKEVA